jgi:hypothetical protein
MTSLPLCDCEFLRRVTTTYIEANHAPKRTLIILPIETASLVRPLRLPEEGSN